MKNARPEKVTRHRELQITDYYRHKAARWARSSAPYQQPIPASFLAKLSYRKNICAKKGSVSKRLTMRLAGKKW